MDADAHDNTGAADGSAARDAGNAGRILGDDYDSQLEFLTVISHPLATKKTTKRIYKVVKRASSAKFAMRGVKEVVKGIKRGKKGLCVLSGDVWPIDVISHIPVLCEQKEIPYIFVPSRRDLGCACGTKRPTSVVLLSVNDSFDSKEAYDKIVSEASQYNPLKQKI